MLGLTNCIRDVVGGSGAVVETGLVKYRERYVCDGILTSVVWLGKNYKESYMSLHAKLRAQGTFQRTYIP